MSWPFTLGPAQPEPAQQGARPAPMVWLTVLACSSAPLSQRFLKSAHHHARVFVLTHTQTEVAATLERRLPRCLATTEPDAEKHLNPGGHRSCAVAGRLAETDLGHFLGHAALQCRLGGWPSGCSRKPSYVSESSPPTGAVQAKPRPHRGRGEEAVHVAAPERQGGAGPLPLQRPRGAPAHSERGDLGLQQGERSLRSPAGGTYWGAGVSPARGPALPQGSGQPQGAPAGGGGTGVSSARGPALPQGRLLPGSW